MHCSAWPGGCAPPAAAARRPSSDGRRVASKPPRRDWTDSERDRIDDLMEQANHRKWLFDMLKRGALWVAAIVVAGRYLWDGLTQLLTWLRDGGH